MKLLHLLSRPLIIFALAMTCAAGPIRAHGWQEGSKPVSEKTVEAVLAALFRLKESAAAAGGTPREGTAPNLTMAVFGFATTNDLLALLPPDTQRILVTYEAIQQGVIDASGGYAPDADVIFWSDFLHPMDAPAVAAHLDQFDAINAFFLGESR